MATEKIRLLLFIRLEKSLVKMVNVLLKLFMIRQVIFGQLSLQNNMLEAWNDYIRFYNIGWRQFKIKKDFISK